MHRYDLPAQENLAAALWPDLTTCGVSQIKLDAARSKAFAIMVINHCHDHDRDYNGYIGRANSRRDRSRTDRNGRRNSRRVDANHRDRDSNSRR